MRCNNMVDEKIYEIRIIKTIQLNKIEQQNVNDQLKKLPKSFKYVGYSRVSYVRNPLLKISKIEPIEGTIINEYNKIMDLIDGDIF